MLRTYLDAGVLIKAARGDNELSASALRLIDDENRQFVSSPFVQLEVLPKAIYHRQQAEADFYQAFFTSVSEWTASVDDVISEANRQASTFGLAAIDALHVAAALLLQADELITTEKPTKPIYRVTGIKVLRLVADLITP
ncbi:MAG: PIN domain-containing protein [Armatimonadota bacterium]|nr:PIN domain-containing protein [Armatimonadota bacterium]